MNRRFIKNIIIEEQVRNKMFMHHTINLDSKEILKVQYIDETTTVETNVSKLERLHDYALY